MNKKLILKEEMGKVFELTPAERARAIIDSPNTRQILERLSAQETYVILKESWGTDSQILLQYVPPEAIGHFIDIDCWDRDSFSVEGLLDWLFEIYNSSVDMLQEALDAIDLDIIILLYQTYIDVVQVVPTDENIAVLLDEGYESFDDVYYFIFRLEDDKIRLLKDMLSLIFTHHQDVYYSIMEGVIWEMKSVIEEGIYERRCLRLMELGFPPPDEAMSIYARVHSRKLINAGLKEEKVPIIDKDRSFLPALYIDHLSRNDGLIVSALGETSEKTRDRFIFEMIYLANKVIMADYRPINEIDELKRSIDKASAISSLGLSAVMKETGRSAAEAVETMNAETLFSLGYNLIQEQKARLRRILQRTGASMIPEGLSRNVEGLLKKRPQYKNGEFSSLDQLEEVRKDIDTIEAMASLTDHIGRTEAEEGMGGTNTGSAIDMESVILTALAVNFLEAKSSFRPLEREEMLSFIGKASLIHAGKRTLVPGLKKDLTAFLGALDPSLEKRLVEDVADCLLSRFEDELAGIAELDALDPRFITCFVVRV